MPRSLAILLVSRVYTIVYLIKHGQNPTSMVYFKEMIIQHAMTEKVMKSQKQPFSRCFWFITPKLLCLAPMLLL